MGRAVQKDRGLQAPSRLTIFEEAQQVKVLPMQVTCVHRQLEARVVGPGSLLGSLRGRRARAPQILMGASSSSSTG